MNKLEAYYRLFSDKILDYTPRVILAVIIFVIGWYAIKMIKKLSIRYLEKRETDPTLITFLMELFVFILKAILFISVISKLGVESSTFVAIIGAAGLAIGLALQGSLGNFAGGVLIIFLKPFKVGDVIEAQGHNGIVQKILIFNTILVTFDNQLIYIPNGSLSNGTIINFTKSGIRRVDLTIGISYSSNIKQAKDIAMNVMKNHELVLETPEPTVWVKDLADSSIDLSVRPWTNVENFLKVKSDILQQVKEAFDANEIVIPFPQRDIHINHI